MMAIIIREECYRCCDRNIMLSMPNDSIGFGERSLPEARGGCGSLDLDCAVVVGVLIFHKDGSL